ncbi:MAG: pilM [Solirubrobacterales bacterium]|jgi:type IV pilus assembly protein PilM|nr:pilM [Solirubrobacterales bacterium]
MNLNAPLGRRSPALIGLDIQPGFVAAVEARVNGTIVAERAAVLPLAADTVRDGEVADDGALTEVLRRLFAESGLPKRVRVGVANQRTVLRTLELPPLTDRKELAAAVAFQAQDQVPMPLSNAVLDFHPLGVIDTPSGPRQRVVLVAAQRDMVERLLGAVRGAGLTAEGVDLSAFALIRSLYRPDPDSSGRVLYLNVDGLTNLAIAEGTVCRFTRVVGSGLEGMAGELAVRRGIAVDEAHALLAAVDLSAPAPGRAEVGVAELVPEPEAQPKYPEQLPPVLDQLQDDSAHEESERAMSYEELAAVEYAPPAPPAPPTTPVDAEVRNVLENGIRDISGEVRNSLDFHRSQEMGGDVSHVVLSGAAQDIPGFAATLELALGVDVRSQGVELADERLAGTVSTHRLAVAAGLAVTEAPQ